MTGIPARDRRLEAEAHAFGFGAFGEVHAVARQQRLVGSDDRLAGHDRRLDDLARRALVAADQLDHQIDLGVTRERHRVCDPASAPEQRFGLGAVAGRRRDDAHPTPGPRRDQIRIAPDPLQDGAADDAEAGDADAQGIHELVPTGRGPRPPPFAGRVPGRRSLTRCVAPLEQGGATSPRCRPDDQR